MFQTEERHWCLIGASNQPNIFIPNFDVSLLPGSELGPKRRSARASRVLETSWSNKQNAKSAHQLFWSHKSHCFGWHCLLLQWSLHMSITGTPSASKFFSSHSLRLSNRPDLDTSTRKANLSKILGDFISNQRLMVPNTANSKASAVRSNQPNLCLPHFFKKS